MLRRGFGLLLLLGTLVACSGGPLVGQGEPRPDVDRYYNLVGINFAAVPDLTVSEANNYYPQADIVWRGDPAGDRVAQIGALFEEAARRNMDSGLDIKSANRRVVIDVTLERFHGLTRRTQFSTGGVYNVIFTLAVRDAATGEVLEPARRVVANLDSWGGNENARLEQEGQTQKVRITDFLTAVLREQLQ